MSRVSIPFHSEDISALSRSLTRQLAELDHVPGHVEMLNLLARAAGFRNFQGLHASHAAQGRLATESAAPAAVDFTRIARLTRYFDSAGRLLRWPGKFSDRQVCLWVIWSRLPPRQILSEKEVDGYIRAAERLGDHVLLRRELVDGGWLTRRPDGREYRRIERQPPGEVVALLRHLSTRA